jgi:hypothetical protein
MVAYLHRAPKASGAKFTLTLCAQPCNGAEFAASETVSVASKREALAVCAARSARPWNF